MEKKGANWVLIIILLIVFWPVGLYLLFQKLSSDKSALMSGKTTWISVIGWFLAICGGLGFLGTIDSGDGWGIITSIAFLVGGIILIKKAKKTKNLSEKYRKYLDLIVNQRVRKIDNISSAMGSAYDKVSSDLQDMINIGYLKDAYIDHSIREIALMESNTPAYPKENAYDRKLPQKQSKATRCPGCGANNIVLEGELSECEYCGGVIS